MKISFVTPTYNSEFWLGGAIGSVMAQDYQDWEHIIVDDASTDGTKKLLDFVTKQDSRIKVITNQFNLGRSASRNIGNMNATGDVICVLDADDIADNKRCKRMAKMFKKGVQFVYGSAIVIDCLGKQISEVKADVFNMDRALETKLNHIVHSTVAYTKDFADKFTYGCGQVSVLGIDDWQQQIRAAKYGIELTHTPHVLGCYRLLDSSISQTRDQEEVDALKISVLRQLEREVYA